MKMPDYRADSYGVVTGYNPGGPFFISVNGKIVFAYPILPLEYSFGEVVTVIYYAGKYGFIKKDAELPSNIVKDIGVWQNKDDFSGSFNQSIFFKNILETGARAGRLKRFYPYFSARVMSILSGETILVNIEGRQVVVPVMKYGSTTNPAEMFSVGDQALIYQKSIGEFLSIGLWQDYEEVVAALILYGAVGNLSQNPIDRKVQLSTYNAGGRGIGRGVRAFGSVIEYIYQYETIMQYYDFISGNIGSIPHGISFSSDLNAVAIDGKGFSNNGGEDWFTGPFGYGTTLLGAQIFGNRFLGFGDEYQSVPPGESQQITYYSHLSDMDLSGNLVFMYWDYPPFTLASGLFGKLNPFLGISTKITYSSGEVGIYKISSSGWEKLNNISGNPFVAWPMQFYEVEQQSVVRGTDEPVLFFPYPTGGNVAGLEDSGLPSGGKFVPIFKLFPDGNIIQIAKAPFGLYRVGSPTNLPQLTGKVIKTDNLWVSKYGEYIAKSLDGFNWVEYSGLIPFFEEAKIEYNKQIDLGGQYGVTTVKSPYLSVDDAGTIYFVGGMSSNLFTPVLFAVKDLNWF